MIKVSALTHKNWKHIKPWMQVQYYGKETRTNKVPRFRLELSGETPDKIKKMALAVRATCIACGHPIRPFRARANAKRGQSVAQHIYLAATCPLNVNLGCSRSGEARLIYLDIRKDLESK